jgi:hypothetical protein
MKTVALYLLWSIPILFFIALFSYVLEAMWNVKINGYAVNLVCIVALVALHYFKFRKG